MTISFARGDSYKTLVAKYWISNDVYTEAYGYILRVCRKCLDKHMFLKTPNDIEKLKGESA